MMTLTGLLLSTFAYVDRYALSEPSYYDEFSGSSGLLGIPMFVAACWLIFDHYHKPFKPDALFSYISLNCLWSVAFWLPVGLVFRLCGIDWDFGLLMFVSLIASCAYNYFRSPRKLL